MKARIRDPLRQWKLSPMDLESWPRWYEYSRARDRMFDATDTKDAPWHVLRSDDKRRARLNCLAHVLKAIPWKHVAARETVLAGALDQAPLRRPGEPETPPVRSREILATLVSRSSAERGSATLPCARRTADPFCPRETEQTAHLERSSRTLVALLALGGCKVGPDFTRPHGHGDAGLARGGGRSPRHDANGGGRAVVERIRRSHARSSDPVGSGAEPAAADCRPAHPGGARPDGDRHRAAVPADAAGVRQRDVDRPQQERRQPGQRGGRAAALRDLRRRVRRGLGAGLLGQVPARCRGRGGQHAGVGGRLLRRRRFADRRGRAHLRGRFARTRCCWSRRGRTRSCKRTRWASRRRGSRTAPRRSWTRRRRARCWRARARRFRSSTWRCSRPATRWRRCWGRAPTRVAAAAGGPEDDPPRAREGDGAACPPRSCGGVPTSAARSWRRRRSAPASASRKPSFIPASRCWGRSAFRARRSGRRRRTCSRPARSFTRRGRRSTGRS